MAASAVVDIQGGAEVLNLWKKDIDAAGACQIAYALQLHPCVVRMNLAGNNIGAKGAAAIADALKTNCSLSWLRLGGNNIGDRGAMALGEALKVNKGIQLLNLFNNNIGDAGVKALAEAFPENRTMTWLGLWNNSFGDHGAESLATNLLSNTTVAHLDISMNSAVSFEGKALVLALVQHTREATASVSRKLIALLPREMLQNVRMTNYPAPSGWSFECIDDFQHFIAHATQTIVRNMDEASERIRSGRRTVAVIGANNEDSATRGMEGIHPALQVTGTLADLFLERCQICDRIGARIVETALRDGCSVRRLSLRHNSIGEQGASRILDMLENVTGSALAHLHLEGNPAPDIVLKKCSVLSLLQASVDSSALRPLVRDLPPFLFGANSPERIVELVRLAEDDNERRAFLLGDAEAGKSTFVQRLHERRFQRRRLARRGRSRGLFNATRAFDLKPFCAYGRSVSFYEFGGQEEYRHLKRERYGEPDVLHISVARITEDFWDDPRTLEVGVVESMTSLIVRKALYILRLALMRFHMSAQPLPPVLCLVNITDTTQRLSSMERLEIQNRVIRGLRARGAAAETAGSCWYVDCAIVDLSRRNVRRADLRPALERWVAQSILFVSAPVARARGELRRWRERLRADEGILQQIVGVNHRDEPVVDTSSAPSFLVDCHSIEQFIVPASKVLQYLHKAMSLHNTDTAASRPGISRASSAEPVLERLSSSLDIVLLQRKLARSAHRVCLAPQWLFDWSVVFIHAPYNRALGRNEYEWRDWVLCKLSERLHDAHGGSTPSAGLHGIYRAAEVSQLFSSAPPGISATSPTLANETGAESPYGAGRFVADCRLRAALFVLCALRDVGLCIEATPSTWRADAERAPHCMFIFPAAVPYGKPTEIRDNRFQEFWITRVLQSDYTVAGVALECHTQYFSECEIPPGFTQRLIAEILRAWSQRPEEGLEQPLVWQRGVVANARLCVPLQKYSDDALDLLSHSYVRIELSDDERYLVVACCGPLRDANLLVAALWSIVGLPEDDAALWLLPSQPVVQGFIQELCIEEKLQLYWRRLLWMKPAWEMESVASLVDAGKHAREWIPLHEAKAALERQGVAAPRSVPPLFLPIPGLWVPAHLPRDTCVWKSFADALQAKDSQVLIARIAPTSAEFPETVEELQRGLWLRVRPVLPSLDENLGTTTVMAWKHGAVLDGNQLLIDCTGVCGAVEWQSQCAFVIVCATPASSHRAAQRMFQLLCPIHADVISRAVRQALDSPMDIDETTRHERTVFVVQTLSSLAMYTEDEEPSGLDDVRCSFAVPTLEKLREIAEFGRCSGKDFLTLRSIVTSYLASGSIDEFRRTCAVLCADARSPAQAAEQLESTSSAGGPDSGQRLVSELLARVDELSALAQQGLRNSAQCLELQRVSVDKADEILETQNALLDKTAMLASAHEMSRASLDALLKGLQIAGDEADRIRTVVSRVPLDDAHAYCVSEERSYRIRWLRNQGSSVVQLYHEISLRLGIRIRRAESLLSGARTGHSAMMASLKFASGALDAMTGGLANIVTGVVTAVALKRLRRQQRERALALVRKIGVDVNAAPQQLGLQMKTAIESVDTIAWLCAARYAEPLRKLHELCDDEVPRCAAVAKIADTLVHMAMYALTREATGAATNERHCTTELAIGVVDAIDQGNFGTKCPTRLEVRVGKHGSRWTVEGLLLHSGLRTSTCRFAQLDTARSDMTIQLHESADGELRNTHWKTKSSKYGFRWVSPATFRQWLRDACAAKLPLAPESPATYQEDETASLEELKRCSCADPFAYLRALARASR